MCNLSEGIYEKGIEEGISKIVQFGLRKGLTCECTSKGNNSRAVNSPDGN